MAKLLSLDDEDNIKDLLQHPGFEPMLRVLTACIEARERDVLKLDLTSPTSIHELLLRKARAEGASLAAADFKRRLTKVRQPSSDESSE